MRYIVLYWFTFHHKRTIHAYTRNLRFLFYFFHVSFALFHSFSFNSLNFFSFFFLLISLRAELKCLTPLNSLLLLSVREKSSSNISERSSAFRTANSSFDVSSRDTVNKGYDNDDEDDNRNHSRYGNYTYFQTPVSKSNKSDAFWKSSRHFNNTISHIDHVIIATTAPPDCMCDANTTDGNSLKSSMTMSVSSAEYRSTTTLITSTPIMAAPIIGKDVINYDHNIFSIARVKKVELHDMTPKVPEFSGKWSE